MNETITYTQEAVSQSNPLEALGLFVVLACLFILGMAMGVMAARPSIPRARVRLRALQYYLVSPQECNDELVKSLVRREIRSLEHRLKVDSDQD